MDADLIGLFALLVGLELILGVDNVLVIAILVSRLPEEKRNMTRNFGLILALVARVFMVIGGTKTCPVDRTGFSGWSGLVPIFVARSSSACRRTVFNLESSEGNSCNC